jgi:ribosome-associated protein
VKKLEALQIARTVVDALEEKKAEDILLLDLRGIAPFTDFFVICSGTSERMLKAIMDSALVEVRDRYDLKTMVEGEPREGWILADYGDIVVHVFSVEQREYYQLEELWSEGKILLHFQ